MAFLFAGVWGPLLIFLCRVADMSIATLRLVFAVRGRKALTAVLGFLEAAIWITAVGAAMQYLNSPLHILGYALGFSAGGAVGMWLEEKLAIGHAKMQIYPKAGGVELAEALRADGFGVTEFLGQGRDGRVEVLNVVSRRRDIDRAGRHIREWEPEAFVLIEEPRRVLRGWLGAGGRRGPADLGAALATRVRRTVPDAPRWVRRRQTH